MKLAIAALSLSLVLAGCSPAEPEPTKDDLAKRPPPAGFHGPAVTPTGATPPPSALK